MELPVCVADEYNESGHAESGSNSQTQAPNPNPDDSVHVGILVLGFSIWDLDVGI
jgi:hypothetical protein